MSKKNKKNKKSDEKLTTTEIVLLITATINLIEAVVELITHLLN